MTVSRRSFDFLHRHFHSLKRFLFLFFLLLLLVYNGSSVFYVPVPFSLANPPVITPANFSVADDSVVAVEPHLETKSPEKIRSTGTARGITRIPDPVGPTVFSRPTRKGRSAKELVRSYDPSPRPGNRARTLSFSTRIRDFFRSSDCKDTPAEGWFKELKKGNVRPGEVSLGQNLSNLLRLALLYKFGGIYVDTDVVVLRSFSGLRNSIGAQTVDLGSGKWSRLNNAVLVFDRKHPLLLKFIEEFTLTFDGNKWGHNGPYMVSRVVKRVGDRGAGGGKFTVLPPSAFYPVDWSRIHGLFKGPRNGTHSKWIRGKFERIKKESYAVHLWNRQSRDVEIEDGSVISRLLGDCCCNLFSNSSSYLRVKRKKK
ncbi:Lactosylceramide 4-alpha-galactosyltransferase [Linum perenne]